jgi:superfamily II DNA or RNA helicase
MADSSINTASPYAWQEKALAKWAEAGRKGIVEAVTGSGKTFLAINALRQVRAKEPNVYTLIVVPTIPLMRQWYDRLRELMPNECVGRIGGDFRDNFGSVIGKTCIAVINSAVLRVNELFAHCKRSTPNRSLLIADECHRYLDGSFFNRILRYPFDYTLGLSATIFEYEVEGLGRVVFEYGFADAYAHGVVPAFDLVNVGVSLTSDEQRAYLDLDDKIRAQLRTVYELYDKQLENVPDHRFFQRLRGLMTLPGGKIDPVIERLFKFLFKRTRIVYLARKKIALTQALLRLLIEQGRKKVIVFFERIASADEVYENVEEQFARTVRRGLSGDDPLWCETYHSEMDNPTRHAVLDEFRRIGASALLVCRSFDEGIDIPAVDAAILVASSQSPRQRIQRVGRTLRKGKGGKRPLVVTLFCKGTTDQNVVGDDRDLFREVATIHDTEHDACLPLVRGLL